MKLSFIKKTFLLLTALFALSMTGCKQNVDGNSDDDSESTALEENSGEIAATYIADPESSDSDSCKKKSYYTLNFYKDNTFKVFYTKNSERSLTTSGGTCKSTEKLNYCKYSGTYSGDLSTDNSEITLTYKKAAKDSDDELDTHTTKSAMSETLIIKSSDLEYETISEVETLYVPTQYDFFYLNPVSGFSKSFYNRNQKPGFSNSYSNGIFKVSWSLPNTTDSSSKDYILYFSSKDDFSSAAKVELTDTNYTSKYVNLSEFENVEKGKTYYFWLKITLESGYTVTSDTYEVKYSTINAPDIQSYKTDNKMRIYEVSNASSYNVYINTENNSSTATLSDTIQSSDFSGSSYYYTVKIPGPGTFWYWVTACTADEESSYSQAAEKEAEKIEISGISLRSDGITVEIDWNSVIYADSYELYYNTTNDISTAQKYGETTTSTSISFTGTAGTKYYFWVKPIMTGSTTDFECSEVKYIRCTKLSKPSSLDTELSEDENSVKLTLYSSDGKYCNFYRNTKDDFDTAELIINKQYINQSCFNICDPLTTNGTYYYWVTYVTDEDESNPSNSTSVEFEYAVFKRFLIFAVQNGQNIELELYEPDLMSEDTFVDPENFEIYIENDNNEYTKVKTIRIKSSRTSAELSAEDTDLLKKSNSFLKIGARAVAADGSSSRMMTTDCEYVYYPLRKPENVKLTSDNYGTVVTWDAVTGADYYKVEYSTSSYEISDPSEISYWQTAYDSSYSSKIEGTSFVLNLNLSYTVYCCCRVQAFTENGDNSLYSTAPECVQVTKPVYSSYEVIFDEVGGNDYYTFKTDGTVTCYVSHYDKTYTGSYTGDATKDGSLYVIDSFGKKSVYTVSGNILTNDEGTFTKRVEDTSDASVLSDSATILTVKNNLLDDFKSKNIIAMYQQIEESSSYYFYIYFFGDKTFCILTNANFSGHEAKYKGTFSGNPAVDGKVVLRETYEEWDGKWKEDRSNRVFNITAGKATFSYKTTNYILARKYGKTDFVYTETDLTEKLNFYQNESDKLLEEFKSKKAIAAYEEFVNENDVFLFFEDNTFCECYLEDGELSALTKGSYTGDITNINETTEIEFTVYKTEAIDQYDENSQYIGAIYSWNENESYKRTITFYSNETFLPDRDDGWSDTNKFFKL